MPANEWNEWTEREIGILRRYWNREPVSAIARRIGRTRKALIQKARRSQMKDLIAEGDYLTMGYITEAFDVSPATASALMERMPYTTFYRGDQPVRAIERRKLYQWVMSPYNWPYFDHDKICDPILRQLLANAKEFNRRVYVTIAEAARRYRMTPEAILYRVHKHGLEMVMGYGQKGYVPISGLRRSFGYWPER